MNQRVQVLKFLFRTKQFQEANFDTVVINVAIEIKQMNFEHALGFSAAHGRANPKVDHAAMQLAVDPRFGCINTVGRELLAVRA